MDSDIINTVVAYIRPFLLDAVVDALRNRPNFSGMSVSDARGFGRHGAHPPHRGETAEVDPFQLSLTRPLSCWPWRTDCAPCGEDGITPQALELPERRGTLAREVNVNGRSGLTPDRRRKGRNP